MMAENKTTRVKKHRPKNLQVVYPPAVTELAATLWDQDGHVRAEPIELLAVSIQPKYREWFIADMLEMIADLTSQNLTHEQIAQHLIIEAEPIEQSSPARSGETEFGRLTREEATQLWKAYKKSGELAMRNQIIELYLPLVRKHVEFIEAKLPYAVQADDLLTEGMMGLMKAIEKFNPVHNADFETFSAIHIRRALMNELHRMERLRRENARLPDEVIPASTRPATISFIFGELATTNRVKHERDDSEDFANLYGPRNSKGPQAQRKRLQQIMIRELSRTERLIMMLYYYEQLTISEIGATLYLSVSQVKKMHLSVVSRLKTALKGRRRTLQGAPQRLIAHLLN